VIRSTGHTRASARVAIVPPSVPERPTELEAVLARAGKRVRRRHG
jgi:hypothetical protein